MENDIDPVITTPQSDPSSSKKKLMIIALIFLELCAIGFAGYIGYTNGKKIAQSEKSKPITIIYPSGTIQPPQKIATVSTDIRDASTSAWTVTKGAKCGINFSTPPFSQDPDNRQWILESTAYSDFLGFFKGSSDQLIHRNKEEASGFVSGLISASCGPIKASTTLETYFSDFHTKLGVDAAKVTMSEAVIEITSMKDVTIMGIPAKEFTLVGGMFDPKQLYYFFLHKSKWYLITKMSDSTSAEVQQQAKQIFDTLSFSQ